MRKYISYILIIFIFLNLLMVNNKSYAIGTIVDQADSFVASGKDSGFGLDGSVVKTSAQKIYSLLLGVGIVVTMAVSVFLRGEIYVGISRR